MSSLRTQGPITSGANIIGADSRRVHLTTRTSVVMGPCVRRDDDRSNIVMTAKKGEAPSRQLVIPLAEPVQAERKADAFFGRLKNNKSRRLGGPKLPEQLLVHHHLRHAAIGQAADKAGAADVLVVEF